VVAYSSTTTTCGSLEHYHILLADTVYSNNILIRQGFGSDTSQSWQNKQLKKKYWRIRNTLLGAIPTAYALM